MMVRWAEPRLAWGGQLQYTVTHRPASTKPGPAPRPSVPRAPTSQLSLPGLEAASAPEPSTGVGDTPLNLSTSKPNPKPSIQRNGRRSLLSRDPRASLRPTFRRPGLAVSSSSSSPQASSRRPGHAARPWPSLTAPPTLCSLTSPRHLAQRGKGWVRPLGTAGQGRPDRAHRPPRTQSPALPCLAHL